MPVAPSYQNLTVVREQYESNGKMYVDVLTKKGTTKTVRWYDNFEYKRIYKVEPPDTTDYRKVFGFDKGYITIFNYYDINNEFFRLSNARFAECFGWYVVSTEEVPKNLPNGIHAHILPWESVGSGAIMKSVNEIKEAINQLVR